MDKRERAKQLLVHYFKMCLQKAGVEWDGEYGCDDYKAEIEDIVDLIVDAAVSEAKEYIALHQEVMHREREE